jgi:phosphate uptake regulator
MGEMAERMDRRDEVTNRRFAETERQLAELVAGLAEYRAFTQLNFDRLTKAMMGLTDHVADHKRRIENLEGSGR